MALFHFYSPRHFERWDWRSPDTGGIGDSETMHIEMAQRLGRRGHRVISYAPLPEDLMEHKRAGGVSVIGYEHTEWRDLSEANFADPGIWVMVRGFHYLEQFPDPSPAQQVWCVFQDMDETPEVWTQQSPHLHKMTRLVTLCTAHTRYIQKVHPDVAHKVVQSRNGLRTEMIAAAMHEPLPVRQPYRLLFASSPDRGLRALLTLFPTIRAVCPKAELHVCYGFDNIEKLQAQLPDVRRNIDGLLRLSDQPGVVLRGRLGQRELYRAWLETSLWCNPTNFFEAGCITAMEAQALGAIPVLNPIWAAGEQQLAGIGIEGDAERDPMTLTRYAMACIYLFEHPELQEAIRPAMMAEAQTRFGWDGVVDTYEEWSQ